VLHVDVFKNVQMALEKELLVFAVCFLLGWFDIESLKINFLNYKYLIKFVVKIIEKYKINKIMIYF